MTKKLIILAIALEILIVISIVFTNLNFYSAINNNSAAKTDDSENTSDVTDSIIDDLENTSDVTDSIIMDTYNGINDIDESSKYFNCYTTTSWTGEEKTFRNDGIEHLVFIEVCAKVFYKADGEYKYTHPIWEKRVISYFRKQSIMDSVDETSLNFPDILISANNTQTSYIENSEFFISNSGRKIGITNYDKKSGVLDFEVLNLEDGDYVTVTGGLFCEYKKTTEKIVSSSMLIRNASGTDQTVDFVINDKNNNEILKFAVICPHFGWDTIYDGNLNITLPKIEEIR